MTTTQELAAALNLGNPDGASFALRTLADLRDNYRKYRRLSDKQIVLAIKLAAELTNPEAHVAAPLGKGITFTGKIQSVRARSGFRGATTLKMTIKVETPEGSWRAWGTLPESLYARDAAGVTLPSYEHTEAHFEAFKGRTVHVKATLKLTDGNPPEPHFVIMTRPVASFVEPEASDTAVMAAMPEMCP